MNKHWIKLFSKTCQGDLCPMQAIIGGIAAQEVMKVQILILDKTRINLSSSGGNRQIHANSSILLF